MSYPFRTKRYSFEDDLELSIMPPGPGWRQFGINSFCTTVILVLCLLLGAFGALLPREVYFQPEPLYFMLFILCWVCKTFTLKGMQNILFTKSLRFWN